MGIKTGESLMFRNGLYEDGSVYRVLEINGERCFLAFVSTNMKIHHRSVAPLSDLKLLEGSTHEGKMAL
jgi:hypothetical protein